MGLTQYFYIKNRSENHNYICMEGGSKMGEGESEKKICM